MAEKTQQSAGDMDPEQFRRYGHQIVDWMADYLSQAGDYPVLARSTPGEIRQALPSQAPEMGEPMDAILDDFARVIVPGMTHWNSPGFLAYFSTTGSGPGILGEMLSSTLNVNAMLWRSSPAATELEQVALGWLCQMLGLPPLFGVINEGASTGVLYALAAAREALSELHIRQHGMAGRSELPRLRLYASEEAHSSIEKAAIILGIGQEGLRKIPTDSTFRMDVDALYAAIREDQAAGWLPFAVVATVGTTSASSIDPVPEIAALCAQYHLWLHVDASYAGPAALLPEMRWILAGCEQADSLIVNPHKWLFTPLDCSVLYTRKPELLKAAFSLVPDYLQHSDHPEDEIVNFMDYGAALGRRFRALKLWMVMRYFGQEGLRTNLRHHIQLAHQLAERIREAPDFELLAPPHLSLVCFRFHPVGMDDETQLEQYNQQVLQHINAQGHFFLSHTKLRNHFTLRVAIGNIRTTAQHIHQLWQEIQEASRQM